MFDKYGNRHNYWMQRRIEVFFWNISGAMYVEWEISLIAYNVMTNQRRFCWWKDTVWILMSMCFYMTGWPSMLYFLGMGGGRVCNIFTPRELCTFCFVMCRCGSRTVDFTGICQGHFVGTVALRKMALYLWNNPGIVTIQDIRSKRILNWNIADSRMLITHWSNHFDIFHRAWQYHCGALCIFSKRFDGWNGCCGWARFEFDMRFEGIYCNATLLCNI